MGKKKPSSANNARGFSTTSVPASASSAAAAAAAAAATASGGKKKAVPAWTLAADPPAPDPPRVPNPVAAPKPKKKDVKAAKLAEKDAAGAEDAVAKRMADFAKDARVGKLEAEIRRQKDQGLAGEQVVVPTKCERLLVDYLVAGAPEKFKLAAADVAAAGPPMGREVTPTDDVNKLLRDLHLVHVACEEHLGLDRPTVHKVMRLAPAPWDLQSVLHTASLVVPGEKLPRGWADKVYFHQMSREERELAVKREEEERGKRRGRGGRGGGKGKAKEQDGDAAKKDGSPKKKDDGETATKANAATATDNKPAVTADDLNLDLDALNVFDLPESATSSDTHKSVQVRSFSTDGWTGKVPKQLLRDTMVREDRNVKIGYPDAKRDKGVRAPPSAFRVQCVINGKSYLGPDYCNSRLEAEHCAAVVGLYNIAKGRPLHRMLPPAYREVWMEVEAREKGKVEESQRAVDSEKVNYLTGLVDMFKAEGVLGPNKRPKFAPDGESGQARSTSASPTPSNSDRISNKHRSNSRSTPLPTRRDAEIQAQRMSLPVAEYQANIQRAIRDNPVVIIAGETGSGKSTQVPQYVLEDVIASDGTGQVFCTQPRRISATSIATRVASEWGDARVGDTIGYSVKLESKVSSKTRLVFCTTGILLRRLESDPTLQGISHVLVDEVHERSLDSDFLLVMLRRLTATRPDLRIVLMSATMNESQFSAYFDRCPVLSIPGRTFPVQRMYLEDVVERVGYVAVTEEFSRGVKTVRRQTYAGNSTQYWEEQATTFPEDGAPNLEEYPEWVRESVKTLDPTIINYELIEATVDHILSGAYDDDETGTNSANGAILVFLPGIGEIRRVFERLKRLPNTWVLPLHSSLSPAQQAQVFKTPPRGTRKIVLSTNIAETGVTIPDAVFVIDTGKAKITRYDEKKHMTRLRESFITQANCRQRQGRAGRVRPGFYFALYSQYRHDHLMADFEVPEVQRMALESTTLKIKVYHFDDIVDTFRKFLDPPPTSRVLAAIERLQATRALDEQLQLTPLGRFLGELPLDVELGKILAFGAFYGCIDAAVTIAAYLSASVQLFDSGSNWQGGAGGGGGGGPGGISRELLYGRSDLLTYYNIFRQWKAALKDGGAGKARAFCNRHSLNYKSLTIIDDTRSQLVDLLPMDFDACNRYNHCLDMIHTALVAAAYPNVLKLDGSARTFVSARGTVTLHGASIFAGESGTAIIASMHAAGILQAGVQVSSAMAQAAATASRDLSPFYCYFTCLHATQILVFDATNVHPLLLAFAVGCQVPLKVNYVARTIEFDKDGVAKIRVPPKTAAHLVEFHLILTRAFEQFLLNPRQADAPGVGDVVDLLYAVLSAPQSSV